tara:strand:- start:1140 stop:1433 length:294 start_codon:yes stop_codon:yes gene_type:complete
MHVGLDNNYNCVHPHARCTIDTNIIGVYYNSEYNPSMYIGKNTDYKNLNIEYGLATGYSGGNVVPMFRVKRDKFFIAPAYEITGNAGVVVGIEWNIL